MSEVRLSAPVRWPSKLIAFPANYQRHIEEMRSVNRADHNGFFLKSTASIVGPNDAIVLPPIEGADVHHECELGLVIGAEGRNIPVEKALDYVFGFTCLIDVTVRGKQERVARKSFDTFTPTGPWLVTRDEVADCASLNLSLTVNGEPRQAANTRDLHPRDTRDGVDDLDDHHRLPRRHYRHRHARGRRPDPRRRRGNHHDRERRLDDHPSPRPAGVRRV